MLRQIIAQLLEFLNNDSLPPSHSSSSPSFSALHQPRHQKQLCLPGIEKTSSEEWCDNVIMDLATGKMLEAAKPPFKRPRKERNKTKSRMEGNMDQEIWHEFPEELFEMVVSRLPIATFFKFRVVCREWNAFIDSNVFSRCCSELPQTIPWFYTVTYEHVNPVQMYDPSLKKWHHPLFPSLPIDGIISPMASVGGLVCFAKVVSGFLNFFVCNPLTRSFKKLPARSVKAWSREVVGMTQNGNSTSNGYKILWVGEKGEYQVYDSLENAWTRQGIIQSHLNLPVFLNFKSKPVAIDSTVYLMLIDAKGTLFYDMVSDEWNKWIIPNPSNLTDDYALAACENRLILVGLLAKSAATCVCIWELEKMTMLWKEVDRMPNKLCEEYNGKHVSMQCHDSKGCMILLSLRSKWLNRLITYNGNTKEWTKFTVPPCGRKRLRISYGIAFHPNPTAKA